ncbi:MAG TPA: hypothetical protein PKE12_06350 [Kiritimatiellia bacterium]|nr:hypothetical protein [Kiritimatiellia bacterium]
MHTLARTLLLVPFVAAIALTADTARAQAPGAPATPLVIRKVDAKPVNSPEYQIRNIPITPRGLRWLQVVVDYEVAPEWVDEATFTYYVLLKAKRAEPGRSPFTLFKGDITYVNIARGRRKADIYMHPSTLARFGDIERLAVVVNVGGRMVALDGQPTGTAAQRWWEQLAPQDGYLLNRMQTPFAMVNSDDFEAIKPGRN